jgi:4-diphosphocytidyl-2-C-methyl-D-erythritol kinase
MSLRALYDLAAPAKINLFLHVVGRRADGYHLLESVFVLIDWTDTLHIERRNDGQLVRHDLGPALPADDLCLRAARALQQASATALGADISILKRVPWGAGMGGGSSDAATTLLALNHLWGLHWPRRQLARIGLTLGADVPFFLLGQHALVQGIGERLTPMSLQPLQLAVVKPPAAIPTRDIFEHPLLKRDAQTVIVSGFPEGAEQVGWPLSWGAEGSAQAMCFGRNDLQPAAVDRCPEVAQAARWLQARYGNSRMTGSGSAVFARVGFAGISGAGAPPLATFPADELPPDWVGRLCHSLVEHPLRGWAG